MTTEMEIVPGYIYDPEDLTEHGNPTQIQKHYSDGAQHVTMPDTEALQAASFGLAQVSIIEAMQAIVTELKTITYYLQTGLGVADEPEVIRSDINQN